MTETQPDLFETTDKVVKATSPILGLTVSLDRDTDRVKACHANIAYVCEGRGPHAAELRCLHCGAHRGWVKKSSASLLEKTVRTFGTPAEPLVIRDATHKSGDLQ